MQEQSRNGGASPRAGVQAPHRAPHPVDLHVGQRLRMCRRLLAISLEELGRRVGINPQQIQKYETGENRISASRLWEIAVALNVPVSHFFEGLEGQASRAGAAPGDILADREAMQFLRAYLTLPEKPRKRLLALARSLGDAA